MTKIKLCGLKRPCDIDYANELLPEFIGFVFAPKSKRYVPFDEAERLKKRLRDEITAVGVFVNEPVENIAYLARRHTIGAVQLHGGEDDGYIRKLRETVRLPVIQAFRAETAADIERAEKSAADFIMLDSGGGTGESFDHALVADIKRAFFLAGGLDSENVGGAIEKCAPYAVDASSSLETDGFKDKEKMTAFVKAVRRG